VGIYGGNVYGEEGSFLDKLHVGFANATIDFPDASIQADCDVDSYNQVVIMNHNQGANASGDFVAVSNNGDDGNFYIDMGINSNVYNNSDYAVTRPNDGYLYVNGGNLIIATETAGKTIEFVTGGMNSTSYVRGTISDSGLSMVGNVTANNFIGNTLSTTGIISAGGNITGNNIFSLNVVSAAGNITGQNLLTTGVVSATGNIQGGNLRTTGSISATGNIRGGNLITATTVINNGVSTSGNITGANILTGGTVSATGNINGANIIANTAIFGTLATAAQLNVTSLGTLTALSVTGNIQAANIIANTGILGTLVTAAQPNVTSVGTLSALSVTGNVSANTFVGQGTGLTGTANSLAVANAANLTTSNFSIRESAGKLYFYHGANAIASLDSGGNLITAGNVIAFGTP
jgi:hypothetical protein